MESESESENMNEFSVDPPNVTIDNLRDFLAHDNLFTEYLNIFLSLPIFPVPYYYSNIHGLFRVNNKSETKCPESKEAPSRLSGRLSNVSFKNRSFQSIPLLSIEDDIQGHNSRRPSSNMSNLVLNKKKGLQWIQKERLHLFLQSQLYAEYRLARILSQVRLIKQDENSIQSLYIRNFPLDAPPTAVNSPICDDDDDVSASPSDTKMESVLLLFGDTSQTDIESWCEASKKFAADPADQLKDHCIDSQEHETEKCVLLEDIDVIKPVVCSPACVDPHLKKSDVTRFPISQPEKSIDMLRVSDLQELSWMLIAAVVKSAIVEVENVSLSEVEDSLAYQTLFPFNHRCASDFTIDALKKTVYIDEPVDKIADPAVSMDKTEYEDRSSSEQSSMILSSMDDQKEKNVKSELSDQPFDYFSTHANVIEFRSFLKKKPSEMNWFLWIDLEKFRLSQTDERKEISILTIKNEYYETRAQFELSVNLKNEIDIVNWKTITNDKVLEIQTKLLEPFFKYWLPSYLLKKEIKTNLSKYASYFAWENLIQKTTQTFIQELDLQEVSIFVLKSPYAEQNKTMAMSTKMNPSNIFTLSPINPKKCGIRRPTVVHSLQSHSVSTKHYNSHKMSHKRNSVPDMKMTANNEMKSPFMSRETEDPMKFFHSANASLPSRRKDVARSYHLTQIEPFDFIPSLPKQLNCINILMSNWEVTESTNYKDFVEDAENMDRYKLLLSLFKALTSEGASGDMFAVYLRREYHMKSSNCLMLWDSIRKFICLFYDQPMLWPKIMKQVKIIYSEYLSASSKRNVECNKYLVERIKGQMDSPTGDMFNFVAENVLAMLIPSWKQYLIEEKCKSIDLLNN